MGESASVLATFCDSEGIYNVFENGIIITLW